MSRTAEQIFSEACMLEAAERAAYLRGVRVATTRHCAARSKGFCGPTPQPGRFSQSARRAAR